MSERPKRESRSDRELRTAREHWCEYRRDPDPMLRWLAWYRYRTLLEGWDQEEFERPARRLGDQLQGCPGWRPPTTFGTAAVRIRQQRREGRLRIRGVGL